MSMYHKSEAEIVKSWTNLTPIVSICCITYNHERYIEQALQGLLKQETTFPFEILIHDDASTDDTANLIREYERRYPNIIRPIYQTENQKSQLGSGMNPRFNYPRANGTYIALCEGDDYWTDSLKLQKQVELMEKHTEVGIIHTKYEILNDAKNTREVHNLRIYNPTFSAFRNYLYTGDMRTLTVMFRSKYLKDIQQLIDKGIMAKAPYGDRATFLTIAAQADILYLDNVTGVYRIFDQNSATRHSSLKKLYTTTLDFWQSTELLCNFLGINDKTYLKVIKRNIKITRLKKSVVQIRVIGYIYKVVYRKVRMSGRKEAY